MNKNETGRVEAFSDGVFGVAITLLVLNIHIPRLSDLAPGQRLINALLVQWPVYLAYATSFLSVLVIWISHHNLFTFIKKVDQRFLLINGLLLMGVTLVPFPTALVAEHVRFANERAATQVYGVMSFVIWLVYNGLWWYASHKHRLLEPDTPQAVIRSITWQFGLAPALYLVGFALSYVSAWFSLAIFLFIPILFAARTLGRRNELTQMPAADNA